MQLQLRSNALCNHYIVIITRAKSVTLYMRRETVVIESLASDPYSVTASVEVRTRTLHVTSQAL